MELTSAKEDKEQTLQQKSQKEKEGEQANKLLHKIHRSLDSLLKKVKTMERTTLDVCEKYDMPAPLQSKKPRHLTPKSSSDPNI